MELGHGGEPLRALAFAGGAFDTALQLGVAHAMLVADCEPPDIVVGISAGAVNAVALAEILQAGDAADADPKAQDTARRARFREVLEAFRDAPRELLEGMLPDAYEINARAPLRPHESPIHHREERNERNAVVNARFGVIRLLNGLLSVPLKLRTITQAARRVMELRRLEECRNPAKRLWGKVRDLTGLWFLAATRSLVLAAPLMRIVSGIVLAGRYRVLMQRLVAATEVAELSLPRRTWEQIKTGVLKLLLGSFGLYTQKTAKAIIVRTVPTESLWKLLNWLGGCMCAAVLSVAGIPAAVGYLIYSEIKRLHPNHAPGVAKRTLRWMRRRYLASLDLQKDLATPYLIKPLLVRLFDREHYGPVNLKEVVERALGDEPRAGLRAVAARKRLGDYLYDRGQPGKVAARHPIYVAPVAASVSRGELVPLPSDTPVVDALLAATAFVPLFRPQTLSGSEGKSDTYIDGISVANEPTYALMDLLLALHRNDPAHVTLPDDLPGVEVYPVSPFPLSKDRLEDGPATKHSSLVDEVLRARQLRRFQDARLERETVRFYHDTLPPGRAFHEFEDDTVSRSFVRCSMHPIESKRPLDLNDRIFRAQSREAIRGLIDEAVADGCRATLQVMLAQAIGAEAGGGKSPWVPCGAVLARRLHKGRPVPSTTAGGPGISEVCARCAVGQGVRDSEQSLEVPVRNRPGDRRDWHSKSDWPVRGAVLRARPTEAALVHDDSPARPTEDPDARSHPRVTLLFSGGVFRGVFQVGVVNALNESHLQPHLVAGSSVGSIMGALVAEVFSTEPRERAAKIALLAATFQSIDRLLLTDRFADFVRRLTLRAGAARFSLRDADEFLRRYDLDSFDDFTERSRRVIAGLERLFYLNPFELLELTKFMRNGDREAVGRQLRESVQKFLDRSGIGQEILGTEPLLLLMREFMLRHHSGEDPDSARFDLFIRQKTGPTGSHEDIHLLATATNLDKGTLEVLTSIPTAQGSIPILKDGLLASSAFPGLFRPRWAWEVFAQGNQDRLVDGGVMDNLPLDAVVQFLVDAVKKGWATEQPVVDGRPVPHLLFTASLEARRRDLRKGELEEVVDNWPELLSYAKTLRHNQKVDKFANAQRHFRLIRQVLERQGKLHKKAREILDVETVVVKPEWLPGTFAFNPMLGFRRVHQSASIAHGCASTLAELHRHRCEHENWHRAWGVETDVDPACVEGPTLMPRDHGLGKCWFRVDATCPFSKGQLTKLAFGPHTSRELEDIYRLCGRAETHRAG